MQKELIVGIVGLALGVGLIYGLAKFKNWRRAQQGLVLFVRFSEADELDRNTILTISGMEVGRVSESYRKGDSIYARINILEPVQLPKNTNALLMQTSSLGGRAIELQFSDACSGSSCLQGGEVIPGKVYTLKDQISGGIRQYALDPLDSIMDSFAGKKLEDMLEEVEASLLQLAQTSLSIRRQIEQQGIGLKQGLGTASSTSAGYAQKSSDEWPALLASLSSNLEALKKLDMQAKQDSLSQGMQRVEELNSSGLAKLQSSAASIDKLNEQLLLQVGEDGRFASWLYDAQLRDSSKAKIQALQVLLEDIRLHPEKYRRIND